MFCRACYLFAVWYLVTAQAQRRWYLTGAFANITKPSVPFVGLTVSVNDVCGNSSKSSDEFVLLFGGVYGRPNSNATLDSSIVIHIEDLLQGTDSFSNTVTVVNNIVYDIQGTVDYESPYQFEIGLYDHQTQTFSEQYYRDLLFGRLFCVSAYAKESNTSVLAHNFLYSMDLRKRIALMSHTWSSMTMEEAKVLGVFDDKGVADELEGSVMNANTDSSITEGENGGVESAASTIVEDCQNKSFEIPLKVMTFNLWHNNPASWVYGMEYVILCFIIDKFVIY